MATAMNVYLTLDYELFLGEKTGTPENCLLRPMDELCKVADKHNFKFVIFVDATYLLRMQQLKGQYKEVDRQYDVVSCHVKSLAEQGHDIELHFHPQWLYSTWDEDAQEWKMDRDHYKLSDLPFEIVKTSLKAAKELLDSIIGFNTTAFRAGGFCLDSFYEYKEIFTDLGIKVDSSVARNTYISTPIHSYDYRNIPPENIYKFNDSVKVKQEEGNFVEMSISSFSWNPITFTTIIRPLIQNYHPLVEFKDGKGISDGQNLLMTRLKKMLQMNVKLASIDGGNSNLMDIYYEKALRAKQKEIIFIGHPKNASDWSVKKLDIFCENHRDELKILDTKSIK